MGKRIFAGAHLCNGTTAVDKDLYMCYCVRINAHHRLVYWLDCSNIPQQLFILQLNWLFQDLLDGLEYQ